MYEDDYGYEYEDEPVDVLDAEDLSEMYFGTAGLTEMQRKVINMALGIWDGHEAYDDEYLEKWILPLITHMSVSSAAERLGVTVPTIRWLIRTEVLKTKSYEGKKALGIDRVSVEDRLANPGISGWHGQKRNRINTGQ